MRYIELALFAEGPTDYRFLSPILRRVTEDLCCQYAKQPVEVREEVLGLQTPQLFHEASRAQRILAAARQDCHSYLILFIHSDSDGDWKRAFKERVNPAIQLINQDALLQKKRTVAIIPVQETEAWALVDGEALRSAFGTTMTNQSLGIPSKAGEVEKISDPKQVFNFAFAKVVSRRRKAKAAAFLEIISEKIELACLREVPAFKRFEEELKNALTQLGIL
ncbi:MAG TPA: hypothetical protein DCM38_08205 [Gammaproteobacteria bacterium]|nr:DUF4276 family protein [Candidatus Parabeggiatoa sp.]HAI69403.1 hypothetical protein [Gammaproteobacteria bacterium]